MTRRISALGQIQQVQPVQQARQKQRGQDGGFGAALQQELERSRSGVAFSKHAMTRAEERGIQVTPDLMDRLSGSVEKAQAKGATNILALGDQQAFIINVPHGRVITTMSQEELKEAIFTNIDGAVIL